MRKYLKLALGCIACLMLVTACDKKDEITSEEGVIYMTQAIDARSNINLLIADTSQSFTFGGAYGGQLFPQQDIQLNFKLDTALVDAYNASHATSYKKLPSDKFSISGLDAVIRSGRTTSESIKVTIDTKMLPKDAEYLMPITLQSSSAGKINDQLKTAYFKIKITRKETDLTGAAVLSVSKDNGGGADAGEGSKKLVDNNLNTKFLAGGFPMTLWMQLKFPEPVSLQSYKLTSGNDASERDPKNWAILASNDGSTWVELDRRTNQSFSGRTQTVQYEFSNDESYSYYRWQVEENHGSDAFQITEWRVITFK
ncbi:BT_3987 domain-containing protein [Niabella insulamsoli]|uniref:BT_3987 domain-containing protein n=1 Tax=Niabella insulamsoli TaxID=3144874 RepID=UPI0031FCB2B0